MFTKRSLNLLFSWSFCWSCNLKDCISFSIPNRRCYKLSDIAHVVYHGNESSSALRYRRVLLFVYVLQHADDKCVLQMARLKQVQRKLAPKGNTIVNISKTFKALHKLQLQSKLTGGIKEPRNWRPSSSALLEIRRYQRTTNLLIPKLSFQRIVKSFTNERFEGIRFQTSALHALQVSIYILRWFEKFMGFWVVVFFWGGVFVKVFVNFVLYLFVFISIPCTLIQLYNYSSRLRKISSIFPLS